MKILYIEDNLEFQICVRNRYLEGHEVEAAPDGLEGIEKFDRNSYDLVLLDYEMVTIHGPDVMRHIRSKNKHIPVVAVSMDDRLNEELLALGATEAIAKRHIAQLPSVLTRLSA